MVIVDPDLGTEAREGRIRGLHHDVTEWVSVPLIPDEDHLIGDAVIGDPWEVLAGTSVVAGDRGRIEQLDSGLDRGARLRTAWRPLEAGCRDFGGHLMRQRVTVEVVRCPVLVPGDVRVARWVERRVGAFQLLEAAGGGRRRLREGHVGGPARSAGRPAEWVGGVLQRAQGDLYVAGSAGIRCASADTEARIRDDDLSARPIDCREIFVQETLDGDRGILEVPTVGHDHLMGIEQDVAAGHRSYGHRDLVVAAVRAQSTELW